MQVGFEEGVHARVMLGWKGEGVCHNLVGLAGSSVQVARVLSGFWG